MARMLEPIPRIAGMLTWALCGIIAQTGYALPEQGTVIAGEMTTDYRDNHLHITQNSPYLESHWKAFDITQGEAVHLQQSDTHDLFVARVDAETPSMIEGQFSAPGRVFLYNPAGWILTRQASIQVQSFYATSLQPQGDLRLSSWSLQGSEGGKIQSEATITLGKGGELLLAAPHVENTGAVYVEAGTVVLACGTAMTVDFQQDDLIHFEVANLKRDPTEGAETEQDQESIQYHLDHQGMIVNDGGRVLLALQTPDDLTQSVMNMEGIIQACTLEETAGMISLRAEDRSHLFVQGPLIAHGESQAGQIEVLGETIVLGDKAYVAANSDTGQAGSIWIGGNPMGAPGRYAAKAVWLDPEAHVLAHPMQEPGRGGQITFWSEKCSSLHGLVATGLPFGALQGGMIETSSAGILDVEDIQIYPGQKGQWLLDPTNITIYAKGKGEILDGQATYYNFAQAPESHSILPNTEVGTGAISNLSWQNIATASSKISWESITSAFSNAGEFVRVFIRTTNESGQLGNITFQDPYVSDPSLSSQGRGELIFIADNDIIFNAPIQDSGGWNVFLIAGYSQPTGQFRATPSYAPNAASTGFYKRTGGSHLVLGYDPHYFNGQTYQSGLSKMGLSIADTLTPYFSENPQGNVIHAVTLRSNQDFLDWQQVWDVFLKNAEGNDSIYRGNQTAVVLTQDITLDLPRNMGRHPTSDPGDPLYAYEGSFFGMGHSLGGRVVLEESRSWYNPNQDSNLVGSSLPGGRFYSGLFMYSSSGFYKTFEAAPFKDTPIKFYDLVINELSFEIPFAHINLGSYLGVLSGVQAMRIGSGHTAYRNIDISAVRLVDSDDHVLWHFGDGDDSQKIGGVYATCGGRETYGDGGVNFDVISLLANGVEDAQMSHTVDYDSMQVMLNNSQLAGLGAGSIGLGQADSYSPGVWYQPEGLPEVLLPWYLDLALKPADAVFNFVLPEATVATSSSSESSEEASSSQEESTAETAQEESSAEETKAEEKTSASSSTGKAPVNRVKVTRQEAEKVVDAALEKAQTPEEKAHVVGRVLETAIEAAGVDAKVSHIVQNLQVGAEAVQGVSPADLSQALKGVAVMSLYASANPSHMALFLETVESLGSDAVQTFVDMHKNIESNLVANEAFNQQAYATAFTHYPFDPEALRQHYQAQSYANSVDMAQIQGASS